MKYYEILKNIREDRDLTQSDIAKVLGTTYQYYSTYEAGKRELPFTRAIELSRYYNISLDYIAGTIEQPRKIIYPAKNLTSKQQRLIEAYEQHPELQKAIDKLLDI